MHDPAEEPKPEPKTTIVEVLAPLTGIVALVLLIAFDSWLGCILAFAPWVAAAAWVTWLQMVRAASRRLKDVESAWHAERVPLPPPPPPPPPPSPTVDDHIETARKEYATALRRIDGLLLDEAEKKAASSKAKQKYLKRLDELL